MRTPSPLRSASFSRRSALRRLACTAGGAAVLAMGIGQRRAAAADDVKVPPDSVSYQTSPKGADQCSTCGFFAAPAGCSVVEGTISPTGWCQLYDKKSP
jgi:hypothetical protein